jgi:hypothetical protein
MAFMVPVVKKEYDIYSRSPPKNKPIVASHKGKSESQPQISGRKQSNSISIAVLQNKQVKQSQRVHSKSVNESNGLNARERQRSTSSSSASHSSSESLEILRKMMHLINLDSNNNNNNNNNNNKDNQKHQIIQKLIGPQKFLEKGKTL